MSIDRPVESVEHVETCRESVENLSRSVEPGLQSCLLGWLCRRRVAVVVVGIGVVGMICYVVSVRNVFVLCSGL